MELFGLEAPLLNATDTENLAFNLYVLDIEERQEQINQLIKFLIESNLYGKSIEVIENIFSLTYLENNGAAWGIFSDNNWILTIITPIIIIAIIYYLYKYRQFDNEFYMVILQCIYLAKRISLNEKEENINNLTFLVQRLTVVEDMFSIPQTSIVKAEPKPLVEQKDYDNLKKNLKTYCLFLQKPESLLEYRTLQ